MIPSHTIERSAAEWTAILDQIQASIAATLERTPEPLAVAPPADPVVAGRAQLEALRRRLDEMQSTLERAERCTGEADAALQAEAETILRWSQALKQVQEKLAGSAA
jgi:hypothetical protein